MAHLRTTGSHFAQCWRSKCSLDIDAQTPNANSEATDMTQRSFSYVRDYQATARYHGAQN